MRCFCRSKKHKHTTKVGKLGFQFFSSAAAATAAEQFVVDVCREWPESVATAASNALSASQSLSSLSSLDTATEAPKLQVKSE